MAAKLHLYLLLLLLHLGWAQEHRCQQSHFSCDKCIETGPECAWCSSPNAKVRCHTLEELQRAGCTDVYNPQPSIEILRNESRPIPNQNVFIQSQKLSIHLRPGRNQTVQLNVFQPAKDLPMLASLTYYDIPPGLNLELKRKRVDNSEIIEVSVDAVQCPDRNQNMTGPWFAFVESHLHLISVTLEINLECHCGCSLNREEKSAACSGRGALVCGHCECDHPYAGENCQTEERQVDAPVVQGNDSCRPNPDAPLCSSRGTCVQGVCACGKQIHPHHISGQYCECDNFNCPFHYKKICGGHGKCECGRCVCDAGWSDEECLCRTDVTPCLARNNLVCNGKGTCKCGQCICNSTTHFGHTCERCPTCPIPCTVYEPCVECRAYGTGVLASRCDEECSYFNMTMVDTKDQLPNFGDKHFHCKLSMLDYCYFYFSILYTRFENSVTVARAKDCPLY